MRISSSLLASLLVTHVGGVPDLAAFGPTAPDNVLELTSGDRKAAREAMRRHPTRFAVLMMAPRVGSKMLWSQLRSYRPGIVHMLMEGNDARLKDELPNATVAERVEALLSKAEAIAIRRTPHHRGRPKAVGFKTAKSCVWDPTTQRYRPTPVYDDASTAALADVWRGAGVRVICLARLNGLAWEISRARKLVINAFYDEVRAKALEVFALLGDGALARDDLLRGVAKNESIAQFRAELRGGQASTILAGLLDAPDQLKHALPKAVDNTTWAAAVSAAATRAATFTVPLDCSRRGLSKIANETLEHVRQFHGECAALGTRTRALWVPYEAIKDGSPRQRKALAAVLDFLNLDRRATIAADTTHDSPGATANYVADAERCRATLAPNPYLGAMLDDPYFPYSPKG